MQLKLSDIVLAKDSLDKFFACRPKNPNDAFRLARIRRELKAILADYDEARTGLLEQYAYEDPAAPPGRFVFVQLDENGEPIMEGKEGEERRVDDFEALRAFTDAHKELLKEEVTVDFAPLTIASLKKFGFSEPPSPDELEPVLWLFEEGQELYGGESSDVEDEETDE